MNRMGDECQKELPSTVSGKAARQYDDAYPTCLRTCATLRIFSEHLNPDKITGCIGVSATSSFRKGDPHNLGKLRRKNHGWFFTTEGLSDSRDSRRHLDLILDRLAGRENAIRELREKGCDIDITCFYDSIGQGGPWLMPYQMRVLGLLDIEIWYDVYFAGEEEAGSNEAASAQPGQVSP